MKRSKCSERQFLDILKEADAGVPVADLLRTHGLSKATLFTWRSQYAGVTAQAHTTRATAMWWPSRSYARQETTTCASATPDRQGRVRGGAATNPGRGRWRSTL